MTTSFIYELIDPITNTPRYIGKAKNPQTRFSGHINDKSGTHKVNWIQSLLKQGLKPILNKIDEVPEKEIDFWEKHYISLYKSWGFNLTNNPKHLGGEGGDLRSGTKNSKEHNEKISFSHSPLGKLINLRKRELVKLQNTDRLIVPEIRKRAVNTRRGNYKNYLSEETKKKIGLGNKGKVRTEEVRKNLSKKLKGRISPNKGNKLSSESKKKMSKARIGKRHSIETLEKLKVANKRTGLLRRGKPAFNKGIPNTKAMKAIEVLETVNGLFVVTQNFPSITQAAKWLKISPLGISAVLNGRAKTYKGYKFILKNENNVAN